MYGARGCQPTWRKVQVCERGLAQVVARVDHKLAAADQPADLVHQQRRLVLLEPAWRRPAARPESATSAPCRYTRPLAARLITAQPEAVPNSSCARAFSKGQGVCTVRAAHSSSQGRRTLDIVVAADSSHRALRLAHALRRALAADVCMHRRPINLQHVNHDAEQDEARCASQPDAALPGPQRP